METREASADQLTTEQASPEAWDSALKHVDGQSAPDDLDAGKQIRVFDRVLLDVPCSGTGVLAKRSDMRWRRTEENLESLVKLQEELLEAGCQLVRPGGLLVYSTCSMEPEENQEQVKSFLARHSEFTVEPPPPGKVPAHMLSPAGALYCVPVRDGVDGAFAVRLRRS